MSEPKIVGGYLLLARKIIESEIYKKPLLYLKVWIYLLQKAQHSSYKQLKRGQVRTSISEIMEACSWYVGYRKVTPTKDQIYQIIEWLRKPREGAAGEAMETTMITTTRATQGMLINIDSYSFYQDPKNYESSSTSTAEAEAVATREQQDPNNINNNEKNDKKKMKSTTEKNKFSKDSIEFILSMELFSLIKNNNPGAKEPNLQTWAKNIDLMIRLDNRTAEGIRQMIIFSQNNDFWKGNILSTLKLREKYVQLYIQSRSKRQAASDNWIDSKEKPYWLNAES
ncbi:hypothetical protein [Candidatus Clostridium radicumherbarum]|uniref:Lin1244/Lin1753-like N-terminal domain-containing protein n=1 Tax=Candidatus Clostridium radicumherbarum TaxID=3381662 RepID=A0ABW8TN14_9CLOT